MQSLVNWSLLLLGLAATAASQGTGAVNNVASTVVYQAATGQATGAVIKEGKDVVINEGKDVVINELTNSVTSQAPKNASAAAAATGAKKRIKCHGEVACTGLNPCCYTGWTQGRLERKGCRQECRENSSETFHCMTDMCNTNDFGKDKAAKAIELVLSSEEANPTEDDKKPDIQCYEGREYMGGLAGKVEKRTCEKRFKCCGKLQSKIMGVTAEDKRCSYCGDRFAGSTCEGDFCNGASALVGVGGGFGLALPLSILARLAH